MINHPRINAPRQAVTPIRINRGSPFARGLVAWYPLGDSQSWGNGYTVYDHSGHHQHGTATAELDGYPLSWGDSGWVSDPPGELGSGAAPGCFLSLEPIDVSKADSPLQTLNGPMSISAWVLMGYGSGVGSVLAQYLTTFNHELVKQLTVSPSQVAFLMSKSDGRYQEKVFSHDLGSYDWSFVGASVGGDLTGGNGIIVANEASMTFTATAFSSTPDTSVPVLIGAKKNAVGYGEKFRGVVRDLRVWNRPQSLAEFKQLFRETGGRMTGGGDPSFSDGGPFQPRGYGSLAQQTRPIPRAAEAVETTAQSAPIFLATTQAGL